MKTTERTADHKIEELVRAAQVAGAAEGPSEDFWREVTAHTALREHQRKQLVTPRRLTDGLPTAQKTHTI